VNPNFPSETGMWLIAQLTGQQIEQPPEGGEYAGGGVDYTGMDVPGMGIDPSLYDDRYEGDAEYVEDDGQYAEGDADGLPSPAPDADSAPAG
ncbi:MAG: hypothetical protein GX558_12640, partial [Clostridiales bacterium]|nr:hypothetical protein [Clostridiales bacterium]